MLKKESINIHKNNSIMQEIFSVNSNIRFRVIVFVSWQYPSQISIQKNSGILYLELLQSVKELEYFHLRDMMRDSSNSKNMKSIMIEFYGAALE